mgnify:CR=1 FL=1
MSKYTGLACFTFALLLSTSTRDTHAAGPQGVWRTFAVYLDSRVEYVDFTDEDSVLIKAEKSDLDPATKMFWGFDQVPDFTEAVIDSPGAMYITKGNGRTSIGSFCWLLFDETPEPPPVGAVALLGPDAELTQVDLGYVYVDGGFLVPGTPANFRMILVTALFSK